MKSMTGYARKQCVVDGRAITIEIKTLNSKQMDVIMKLPSFFRAKELELRAKLNALERGKIDVLLTEEQTGENANQLNKPLVASRYAEMQDSLKMVGVEMPAEKVMECVFRQPDVWASSEMNELSEEGWNTLSQSFDEAVATVDEFRCHEGAVLEQDFKKHVDLIETLLAEIPQYESSRLETAKDRIRKYFAEMSVKDVDENRFEQELIYYLEKLDITEEKVRLAKHIDYFRQTMAKEPCCGKKLGFVAQEMGREINTTGSKANHVDIQRIVVQMKDELEKIKEQLGNIL